MPRYIPVFPFFYLSVLIWSLANSLFLLVVDAQDQFEELDGYNPDTMTVLVFVLGLTTAVYLTLHYIRLELIEHQEMPIKRTPLGIYVGAEPFLRCLLLSILALKLFEIAGLQNLLAFNCLSGITIALWYWYCGKFVGMDMRRRTIGANLLLALNSAILIPILRNGEELPKLLALAAGLCLLNILVCAFAGIKAFPDTRQQWQLYFNRNRN